ncbi:hypothetical protein KDX40_04745 [Burkholderia ambifaria]|uniref:hypothetical protein n=1 Tax=Burkholderia ambifaria TaxID=152480 RepID=UPI001BA01541|nr:hypothetical protein [Burkholderia ambifaria]MBR8343045.1 hypothetical protein [Burkholderia ambifaria]
MSEIKHGGPGEIPPVRQTCPMDVFENAIRAVGVVNACEWFGHTTDSEFTRETITVLISRSMASKEA